MRAEIERNWRERLTPPFGGICFDAGEHSLEEVAYFAEVGVEDALGPTACQ